MITDWPFRSNKVFYFIYLDSNLDGWMDGWMDGWINKKHT